MELLLQAVNGETEVKIKPLSASCSHQAVKRGGGSESSPPSRLDRSHGGCYESTAQVCARLLRRTSRVFWNFWGVTYAAAGLVSRSCRISASICHPCPCFGCYSTSSEVQSAAFRLTDGLYPFPHFSVQQIKLASWPPEHTEYREGPRLRPGQIQFTGPFFSFSLALFTRSVWSLFLLMLLTLKALYVKSEY